MAGRSRSDPTASTASRSLRSRWGSAGGGGTSLTLVVRRRDGVGGSASRWGAPAGPARQTGRVTTRVFLLDDHEVVRRGLRELLRPEEGRRGKGGLSTGGSGWSAYH